MSHTTISLYVTLVVKVNGQKVSDVQEFYEIAEFKAPYSVALTLAKMGYEGDLEDLTNTLFTWMTEVAQEEI